MSRMPDHVRALLNHAKAGAVIRVSRGTGDVGGVLVMADGKPVSSCRLSCFRAVRDRFAHVAADATTDDYKLQEAL